MRGLAPLLVLVVAPLDCGLSAGTCSPACAEGYVCSFDACVPVHVTTCVTVPDDAFCQAFCDRVSSACVASGAAPCGVASCLTVSLCRDGCLRADAARATLFGCVVANGTCAAANACVRECDLLRDAGVADVTPLCGAVGLPCCASEGCVTGAVCSLNRCYACGANGQVCCAGGACDVGHVCLGTTCTPAL